MAKLGTQKTIWPKIAIMERVFKGNEVIVRDLFKQD